MTIESLHIAFIVCLAFCILFFIISIVLFFVFDIIAIFNIRTGRTQKKKINEMQQQNALTGRLISNSNSYRAPSMSFSTKLNNIKKNLSEKQQNQGQQKEAYQHPQQLSLEPQKPMYMDSQPAPAPKQYEGSDQTTLLSSNRNTQPIAPPPDPVPAAPAAQTVQQPAPPQNNVPQKAPSITNITGTASPSVKFEIGGGDTVRLSQDMLNETPQSRAQIGVFNVVKMVILTHTEETIG